MKQIVPVGLLFLGIILSHAVVAQNAKIGVISDLHYTHPSLIVEEGRALDNYLANDRKLLLESDAILRQSVRHLLEEEVNIVLIPGDLTKDGEKVSHQGVAQLLQPLREKGVKVLVVPGNHDINNPDAVSFHGDEIRKAETISAEDFSQIYADFGYAGAVSRDAHSLSYVSEPMEGFRVLCIDACKYYDNTFVSKGDDKDLCVTHGAIRPETMEWIRTEMQIADILGKQVIAMMHHNVVEHFDHQGIFAAPYMVDNFKDVQRKFLNYGINVLFTGHFHSSDISQVDGDEGRYLCEIETGSIVTYPCPYRIIDMVGNSLYIETKNIEEIDYPIPGGMDFQAYAKSLIEVGFNEMVPGLIHDYHHTFSGFIPKWAKGLISLPDAPEFSDMLMSRLSPGGIHMMLAHYSGNEDRIINAVGQRNQLLTNFDELIRDLSKASAGRFAPIAERFVRRMDIVKKAKEAMASIWDNMVVTQNDDGLIYIKQPVNDLHLALDLKPAKPINAVAHVPEKDAGYAPDWIGEKEP